MIRTILASSIGLLASIASAYCQDAEPAAAATEPAAYDGVLLIKSASAACDGYFAVTDAYNLVVRFGVRPNGEGGGFQIVGRRSLSAYEMPPNKAMPSGAVRTTLTGNGISSRVDPYGPFSAPVDLVFSPSPVKASTQTIAMSGTITNLGNVTGCTVSVLGSAALR